MHAFRHTKPGQTGQAYVEYLVLLAFTVLAFAWMLWTDNSIGKALKSFFDAYSFSLSLP